MHAHTHAHTHTHTSKSILSSTRTGELGPTDVYRTMPVGLNCISTGVKNCLKHIIFTISTFNPPLMSLSISPVKFRSQGMCVICKTFSGSVGKGSWRLFHLVTHLFQRWQRSIHSVSGRRTGYLVSLGP